MLKTLRRYLSSNALDRPDRQSHRAGEFDAVHRLLSVPGSTPRQAPSPALRSRIMGALRESPAPSDRARTWRWAAAAACAALAIAAVPILRPTPRGPALAGPAGIPIPMDAAPVLRLVAGQVDRPLLEQAQKMYADTRRATRVVVNCVPFARGG